VLDCYETHTLHSTLLIALALKVGVGHKLWGTESFSVDVTHWGTGQVFMCAWWEANVSSMTRVTNKFSKLNHLKTVFWSDSIWLGNKQLCYGMGKFIVFGGNYYFHCLGFNNNYLDQGKTEACSKETNIDCQLEAVKIQRSPVFKSSILLPPSFSLCWLWDSNTMSHDSLVSPYGMGAIWCSTLK